MTKLKKLFSTTALAGLMAFALVGCSGTPKTEDTNDTTGGEIKIGVNYELSGDVASYGQDSVNGIKMAIEEINAAGGVNGKQIKLIEIDNKSDEAESISVATRLMTQDKVVAVLGPATSGKFKAQVQLAEAHKIPILSGSTTADDVTVDSKGVKEFAFRICFSDSFQGVAMANFAKEKLNAKSAIIIADNSSDYGKGLAKNFKETFTKNGGTIVAEEAYVAKDTDFNAILTNIKGKKFDVIFIPGYYSEAGLIIKQARKLGITAPILGADGFDSPTLLKLAGTTALNDVYYSNHYSALDQDPLVIKFIEDYNAKYGQEPGAFAALGYDEGKFIADAIARAGSEDPIAIKDALANTTNFVGVTGSFSIDENHNPVKSIVVIGLKDGVPSTSEKINP